ncbi:MAG: hypothetical protein HLUCCA08_12960 [Rhodobacteraceae bacterium HLUCCA08]|nr:MAG: hypothetical protein HLUCCA08_12960 [Rhodobacteraceae bacterium HLUCCA08]
MSVQPNDPLHVVPLSEDTSQTIRNARVICILFMMTVHIWPGSERILAADVPDLHHVFYTIVVDYFGRASVPLLSIFSGILLAQSVSGKTAYLKIAAKKAYTLVPPIVFWSVPIILLTFAARLVLGRDEEVPTTLVEWLNALFGVFGAPANSPLHFLRDIFIMSIIGLAAIFVFRRSQILALALLGLFLFNEHDGDGFILFRNQIGSFYIAGMLIALYGASNWVPRWTLVLAVLVMSEVVKRFLADPLLAFHTETVLRAHLPRLAMTLLMWRIGASIYRLGPRFIASINRLERHIFVVFCSHSVTIKFFGLFALLTGLSENSAIYLGFFLVQVPICLAIGVVLSIVLKDVPLANGGRRSRGTAGLAKATP